MVWSDFLLTKSLLGGGGGGEWWWQTKFNVSPGPGLWPLVLGPFGPDLGPDLDLTWDLDLDLSLTKNVSFKRGVFTQLEDSNSQLNSSDTGIKDDTN